MISKVKAETVQKRPCSDDQSPENQLQTSTRRNISKMWNRHNVPPGFLSGQRMELNPWMMEQQQQQPWAAAVNASYWSPAYVPAADVWMNSRMNPIGSYGTRTVQLRPYVPVDAGPPPWLHEPRLPPPPVYVGVPAGDVWRNPIGSYGTRTVQLRPYVPVHAGPPPFIHEPRLPPPPSDMWGGLHNYWTTTQEKRYNRHEPKPTFMESEDALDSLEESSPTQEKCYDLNDPTLTFVDGDDELDFLCEDFQSPRALMSCGHAVTPTSLTNWCRRLLDEGRTRFVCGQTSCNVEWSYEEVCRMALLTPQEKMHFEKTLKTNADKRNTKACPGCSSPVVRSDQSNLRVRCSVCSVTNRRIYDFCWQCMREWRGPDSRPDHCGNDDCRNESLKTLQTCPEIELDVMCPSTRACPSCGILLQHDNTGCNDVDCPRCGEEFCFVCLKLSDECEEEYFHVAAPRQTSIPVWRHNSELEP